MKVGGAESAETKRRFWNIGVTRATLLVSLVVLMCTVLILTVTEAWTKFSGTMRTGHITRYNSPLIAGTGLELCENGEKRAVIYNKSPKTASSFILSVIVNWTEETSRPLYRCYRPPVLTVATIQSCVPKRPDPCGVFTEHVYLNPYISKLFNDRFPNHLLVTSTRYPAHRIVSMFLFTRNLKDDDPLVQLRLAGFLEHFEPWSLYNYHTGESRTGTCPLTNDEKKVIFAAVSRFDVVIDMNSVKASNAILKHHNLFTLPVRTNLEERHKERGAVRVNMTDDLLKLVDSTICVEKELHMAFQFRMAALYEEATGEECMFSPLMPAPDTCVTREEQESLKDYWHV